MTGLPRGRAVRFKEAAAAPEVPQLSGDSWVLSQNVHILDPLISGYLLPVWIWDSLRSARCQRGMLAG